MSIAITGTDTLTAPRLWTWGRALAGADTFNPARKFPPIEGKAEVLVRNLNVSIKGAEILKNINITIPEKKITCVIGPSGCGKSTLLKTFDRLIDYTEGVSVKGEVIITGENVISAGAAKLSRLRRIVGYVAQHPTPLPMSIYDNIAYGCRIHGIRGRKRLDRVVEYYLKAVGLWDEVKDRLRSPAVRMSGGQQQRLCLARSLAVEPGFILADEATSALDPIASRTIEDLFLRLKNEYSIIMVTHTLRQALRIADYVVFMFLGEVIEAGEASQVFRSPKKELTRKYISGAFS